MSLFFYPQTNNNNMDMNVPIQLIQSTWDYIIDIEDQECWLACAKTFDYPDGSKRDSDTIYCAMLGILFYLEGSPHFTGENTPIFIKQWMEQRDPENDEVGMEM